MSDRPRFAYLMPRLARARWSLARKTLTPSMKVIGPDGSIEREVTWIPAADVSPAAAYQSVIEAAVAQAAPDAAQQTRLRLEAFPKTDRVSVSWGAQVDANEFL